MIQFIYSLNSNRASAKAARLYLLLGQSNSNGEGTVDTGTLPANLSGAFANVKIINRNTGGTFAPLEYGVNQKDDFASGRSNGIGQELELGRLLAEYYKTDIYFIKVATGGVGVAAGQPWYYENGSLHTSFESYYNAAVNYFNSNNIEFVVCPAVWVQGEFDARSEADANAYSVNVVNAWNRIKTYVGNSALPIVQVRLRPDIPRTYVATVRAAQEQLATDSTTVHWINADDVTMVDSGLHYSMNGQIELSNRIFNILKTF